MVSLRPAQALQQDTLSPKTSTIKINEGKQEGQKPTVLGNVCFNQGLHWPGILTCVFLCVLLEVRYAAVYFMRQVSHDIRLGKNEGQGLG